MSPSEIVITLAIVVLVVVVVIGVTLTQRGASLSNPQTLMILQGIFGILIFIAATSGPAMILGGYHKGPDWGYPIYTLIAAVGGAVGGWLMSPVDSSVRVPHRWAGLIGGTVAGAGSLLGLAFYVSARASVLNIETFIVALIAALPGLGVYLFIRDRFYM